MESILKIFQLFCTNENCKTKQNLFPGEAALSNLFNFTTNIKDTDI